jgi:serine/threonine protein kinase
LLQPGEFVADHLRVISFLGSGGMSHVYKCQDDLLSRIVAVKTLRAGFSDDSLRRLQTEGKAIATLDHPNIVKLYGLRVGGDAVPVLTMEFVDGISLASLLEKEGALSVSRSLRIALQIAEALTSAQRKGIIHRDLKPANIMILNAGALDEKVKILDFGIAKIQNDLSIQATQTGDVFGTPQYMSPEQALGKKCDGRTDQYSLGCVLFEMLCGHPPFEHDNMVLMLIAHAQGQVPPLSKSMKEPPSKKLEALVSKLLQKDPEARYDLMYDVSQAIFQATTQSGGAPGRMIGIALALVAIVAAVFVFNIRGTENKVIFGQSLTDKSMAVQKTPVRAPSPESAVDLGLPVGATSLPSGEFSHGDQVVLSNLGQYIHGTDLNLDGVNITDASLERLGRIQSLKTISLRKCAEITSAGVASISHLPLTELSVEDTSVDDSVGKILSTMPTLKSLNLSETEVTAKTCAQIVSLPVLQTLKLRKAKIDASAVLYLSRMKNLIELDLAKCPLVGGSISVLKNSSIEELNLSHVPMTSADFDGISQMKNLRALYVDDTGMTKDDLQKLSRLRNLNRITLTAGRGLTAADIVEFHKHAPLCLINQDKMEFTAVVPTVASSLLVGPDLIKNGDFEEGKRPAQHQKCVAGSSSIPYWKVVGGAVDWVNKSERNPGSGASSIELNGTVEQTISTIPGREYCLRFKAASSSPSQDSPKSNKQQFELRVGQRRNNYSITAPESAHTSVSWNDYNFAFAAFDEKTPVEFSRIVTGAGGPCIDMVSVKLMSGK